MGGAGRCWGEGEERKAEIKGAEGAGQRSSEGLVGGDAAQVGRNSLERWISEPTAP